MNRFRQSLMILFSGKYAGVLVMALAVIGKTALIFFYEYIGRDKMYHLSASYNLLHGKGWTNSFYYTDALNKEVLESFCLWPPGYGLLLVPVQYFTGNNLHLSASIVESVFFITFIFLCRGILRTQKMSRAWLNISTLLLAFYPHEFIEVSLGTDLPGLCFMLGFFYLVIRLWQNEAKRFSLWLGATAGLCLFMAGFTRYMYVPVAIFSAVCVLSAAYWKNNRQATRAYWICLLVCVAGVAISSLYQSFACEDPFYIGTDKKSFFPENLQHWHPAALAAFLNLNVDATFLQRISSISFSHWQKIFAWTNLLVYGLLVFGAIRFWPRIKRSRENNFPVFEAAGFAIAASVVGELALLSLTNSPKYTITGNAWTFIIEGRYHAFPVVFLQLFFLHKISKETLRKPTKKLGALCLAALFALLCVNTLHQLYFTTKVIMNFNAMKSAVGREQDYDFVQTYLQQLRGEQPDKDLLITSSDAFYPLMGSVYGAKGIKDITNIESLNTRVTSPSILLAIIPAPQLEQYRNFINRQDVQLIREINGTYIYRQDLK